MSGEQTAMWRKLLLVVLLLGIGYVIWRRMQKAGVSAPVADLSAKPPTPVPSALPPSPVSSPPASTPSATGSTPRPVVTRIHRGAPPSTRRSTTPSGDAASVRRNGVDNTPGTPTPETSAQSSSAVTPRPSETAGLASSLPETARDQGTTPAETTPVEANVSVATITEPDQPVATGQVTASTTTTTATTADQAASEAETIAIADPMLSNFTPIDINRADREALLALPGIGPVLAERIIAYREAHGPFKSVDDLTAISGIGERNINIFRKLVYVDPNG